MSSRRSESYQIPASSKSHSPNDSPAFGHTTQPTSPFSFTSTAEIPPPPQILRRQNSGNVSFGFTSLLRSNSISRMSGSKRPSLSKRRSSTILKRKKILADKNSLGPYLQKYGRPISELFTFKEATHNGYRGNESQYRDFVEYAEAVLSPLLKQFEQPGTIQKSKPSICILDESSLDSFVPSTPNDRSPAVESTSILADISFKPYEINPPPARLVRKEEGWLAKLRAAIEESCSIKLPPPKTSTVHALLTQENQKLSEKIDELRDKPIIPPIDRTALNFPSLTQEALAKITWALRPGSLSDVIVQGFKVAITKNDIFTLKDCTWLNDEVINFYGQLILQRSNSQPEVYPKLHFFNSFFYTSLRDVGYAKVRRWTKKFDLFSLDYVIFPVHLHVHWCCGMINLKKKRFEYYDSLHGQNPQFFKLMRLYLTEEHRDKKKSDIDLSDWEDYAPLDIPAQQNGYDCGVFASMFAEFLSRDEPFCFNQEHMPYLRKRMIYEIATQQLLVRK
ncbi:hypothetical protein BKA69DRAFT_1103189 [Paraphysoderma sedebokerense]|nr:hypothetical protein BKA69DRAFT_1103189 [Paraphysoderma sedebokerense]